MSRRGGLNQLVRASALTVTKAKKTSSSPRLQGKRINRTSNVPKIDIDMHTVLNFYNNILKVDYAGIVVNAKCCSIVFL